MKSALNQMLRVWAVLVVAMLAALPAFSAENKTPTVPESAQSCSVYFENDLWQDGEAAAREGAQFCRAAFNDLASIKPFGDVTQRDIDFARFRVLVYASRMLVYGASDRGAGCEAAAQSIDVLRKYMKNYAAQISEDEKAAQKEYIDGTTSFCSGKT